MNLLTIFVSALVLGLSGAVMPGPLLTVTMERVIKADWRQAIWTSTGHAAAELLLVVGLSFGLGAILTLPPVAGAIGFVGGLLLAWMGWGMISTAWRGEISPVAAASDTGSTPAAPSNSMLAPGSAGRRGLATESMVRGVAATVSNPYWFLWWATVGTTSFVLWTDAQAANLAAFYTGHILADYSWLLLVSIALHAGKKAIAPSTYRYLIGVLGGFLLFLAAYFIYSSFTFIL